MSRLEIPFKHRTLWTTGDLLLRAELDLFLKDGTGAWQPATFLVDSGSEMTTMPAHDAAKLSLAMPQRPAPGAIHTQTGLPIRPGYLRVRVAGMDPTEYVFPCFFLGDPAAPPAARSANAPRKLLGLSGVVDKLRIG
ncbi:MAG TPA: hypothetical protein VMS17_08195, partial [Gemmataceae bacterium]|nr:hypothetical protein [Gemmataceae bacterium]